MLPSMPILFTRESQDGFGNKIEPSTSYFNQNTSPKTNSNSKEDCPIAQSVETQLAKPEAISKSGNSVALKDTLQFNDNTIESVLVRTYYTKVQSRFASNQSLPNNKFVQFHKILKSFDPSRETPLDLYRKIEQLFGDVDKDIVEEFLLFLKPGQAAEVGKFMDHFSLTKMTNFIHMLQNTFARKPTVLRKIFRAISTGINTGSSDAMKSRVLPHLRSNPRLTLMFKSLFPDERPPDSLYTKGSDMVNESFLTNDNGYDVWEFNEENDKKKVCAKEGMDTVYLNGRVFLQHGRMLRAACVNFPYSKEPYRAHSRRLAPHHTHPSPPESDDERSSPKRTCKNTSKKIPPKRPKKQVKTPTKNVKDVNDNTKHKDCTNIANSPKVRNKSQNAKKVRDNKKEIDKVEIKREKKEKIEKRDESKTKVKIEPAVELQKEAKVNDWTREEDKTILQVLKGEAGSEQVFGRIKELLPHRSPIEIKERLCHVMDLLQQMAVVKVT